MGRLYDARLLIERVIAERKLEDCEVKGRLSLKTGFFINFVSPDAADDPAKLERLRVAAREVLNIEL